MYYTPGWGALMTLVGTLGGGLGGVALTQWNQHWLHRKQADDQHRLEQRAAVATVIEAGATMGEKSWLYAIDLMGYDETMTAHGVYKAALRAARLVVDNQMINRDLAAHVILVSKIENLTKQIRRLVRDDNYDSKECEALQEQLKDLLDTEYRTKTSSLMATTAEQLRPAA